MYGYADQPQYDEILRCFAEYGHVLDHRGSCRPGRSNWIAIQYASPLQAAKALCHQHVQLQDGIFCGVKALPDNDPLLLQSAQPTGALFVSREPSPGIRNDLKLSVVAADGNSSESGCDAPAAVSERDILLHGGGGDRRGSTGMARDANRSLCDKLLRWILSISD